MFNKKEEKKAVTGSKNQSPTLNMISEGTSFKGIINTDNDIRIAGKTDGELSSKGKMIVTSGGNVEGDMNAKDADIAGKVDGELRVTNKLTLRKSAVINGDIYVKTLIVEEGAEMNGTCHMGTESEKSKNSTFKNSKNGKETGPEVKKEFSKN